MMIEFIYGFIEFVKMFLPEIISVAGMILTFVEATGKIKKNTEDNDKIRTLMKEDYNAFRNQIKEDLKDQMDLNHQLMAENKELKAANRELKELLTKVRDHHDGANQEGQKGS